MTDRDIQVFLAVVEHSTTEAAAHVLGISAHTVNHHLDAVYAAVGAQSRAHAAWLLYPALHDRYVLPGDRRALRDAA